MRYMRLPLAILALAAIAACGGGKSSSNGGSNGGSSARSEGQPVSAGMPNCGDVQPVWANLRTKKYHEPGDPPTATPSKGSTFALPKRSSKALRRPGVGNTTTIASTGTKIMSSRPGGYQSNDSQSDDGDSTSNP